MIAAPSGNRAMDHCEIARVKFEDRLIGQCASSETQPRPTKAHVLETQRGDGDCQGYLEVTWFRSAQSLAERSSCAN
jgi:hypothetical protein